ncbi:MAG: hypothetical protein C5B49_03985 [Bdellovibrio sp.]|nr:MAG: hypothetical protein C5B49_03985 [Bdellovibrio sp.]
MGSEAQKFLMKTIVGELAGWGEGIVQFYFRKNECQQPTDRPHFMNCKANSGIIHISYSENFESSRTLALMFKNLEFRTTLIQNQLVADLSFNGSNSKYVFNPSTIQLRFPADSDGTCKGFGRWKRIDADKDVGFF